MKVIVTGASGKLAQHFINSNTAGYEIIGLTRSIDSVNKSKDIKYLEVDGINDPDGLRKIFLDEKPDAVLHLAGMTGQQCQNNPSAALQANVSLTKILSNLSVEFDVKKFIFASSAAVYRQKKLEPTNENSNVEPASVYGNTKLQAESLLNKTSKLNPKTNFICLRFFNIYGSGFSDSLIEKLLHSSPTNKVPLSGMDNFVRDYVHISDILAAINLCLTKDFDDNFKVLNIASGIATSNKKLLDTFSASKIKVYFNLPESDLPNYSWADIAEAKKLLGYKPSSQLLV